MKRCRTCSLLLPFEDFYSDARMRDSRFSTCKSCTCKRAIERKNANPDLRRREVERSRRYRKTPAGQASRRREYESQREAIVRRATEWGREHPERRRQLAAEYVARNPERRRVSSRVSAARRRALLARVPTDVSASQIQARVAFYGERCWCCGAPWEQIDHVKPISKGGAHLACNLRPICASCNRRKSAQWPYERKCA